MSDRGTSFTFLTLLKRVDKIEIPIIQRDYAQGRESAVEKRSEFLDTIFKHLKEQKNLNLDFIYGVIEGEQEKRFVPLDGQQRLTTLFLLYWYFAYATNHADGKGDLRKDGKSKLSYATRASAREFCDALVKYDIEKLPNGDKKLSQVIKNEPWYFSLWDRDPTIRGVLTMLDAIHKKSHEGGSEAISFDRLECITFQFMDLNGKKFKLTDELYVKMNARGKQLTAFEHFKAKIEGYMGEEQKKGKALEDKERFSRQIDTKWTDLFWRYTDQETEAIDSKIMSFILTFVINYYAYAAKSSEDERNKNIEILLKEKNSVSFFWLNKRGIIDDIFIEHLIALFDLVSSEASELEKYLPEGYFYFQEEVMFKSIIRHKRAGELTYSMRLQWFAYYSFLMKHKHKDGSVDCDSLRDWMRVIHNLIENTIYNRAAEFCNSVLFIQSLVEQGHSQDILSFLRSIPSLKDDKDTGKVLDDEGLGNIAPIPSAQIIEECIKAHLMQRSEGWKEKILEYEQHLYFKGQIGFLLKFSGIYDEKGVPDFKQWDDQKWEECERHLDTYYQKATSVFCKDGLCPEVYRKEESEDYHYLWQRALLVKGDYLLGGGHKWSFLHEDGKHRDVSWKRLLRNNDFKTKLIKDIFDDEHFESEKLAESLRSIIKKSGVSDWRRYLIEEPEIIQYIGEWREDKFIRKYSDHEIYLLKTSAMHGAHAEYYSYALYCNIKGKNEYYPAKGLSRGKRDSDFQYHSVNKSYHDACFSISWEYGGKCYKMNISYKDKKFYIDVGAYSKQGSVEKKDEHICAVLQDEKYKVCEKEKKYILSYGNPESESIEEAFESAKNALKSLCKKLQELPSRI